MSKGLALPLGASKRGGAAMVDGDDQAWKIISIALSDRDSDHAYRQGAGLGEDMIYDINDPTTQGPILQRITRIFKAFEARERFKLVQDTIKWEAGSKEGELTLHFSYLDMETDEERPFQKTYTGTR